MSLEPTDGIRDIWLFKRQAVRTCLKQNSFVIPAFITRCGQPVQALRVTGYNSGPYAQEVALTLADSFTVEFWFKDQTYTPAAVGGPSVRYLLRLLGPVTDYINIYYDSNSAGHYQVTSNITSTADVQTIVGPQMSYGVWNHFALTSDGSSLFFYINGELVGTTAITGPYDFSSNVTFVIGTNINGFYNELRVWNQTRRTQQQIQLAMFAPRSVVGAGTDVGLSYYWRFLESTLVPPAVFSDGVGGVYMHAIQPTRSFPSVDDCYPRSYGASTIAGIAPVSVDENCSIVFPINAPATRDHAMYVSWTDGAGVFQRRCLYHANDGGREDIAPAYVDYAGEMLGTDFTIEIWNIDGTWNSQLVSDITVYISTTTQPTTSTDVTSVIAATPAYNTYLSVVFPSTNPLTPTVHATFQ